MSGAGAPHPDEHPERAPGASGGGGARPAPPAERPEPPAWLGAAGLPEPAADVPALRVSDADRERTVAVLHEAATDGRLDADELEARTQGAYSARFAEDLARLTADLAPSPPAGGALEPAPATARMPVRADGGRASNWVVSIMGGSDRRGHWRVGETCTVVDVMGGSDLDLNDAELSAERTTIRVFSIMGGSNIRVPEGLNVEISELAIMGGNDARVGEQRPDPGGPTVRIEMYALMGGSSVRRGRRRTKAQRREERRLEKQRRREARDGDR